MASPRVDRRLAAVLAADIKAYTRLIERDEEGTLARIRSMREGIFDPILGQHDGRVVKFLGDGFLAEFQSVCEAVQAAVDIQSALDKSERDRPEADRIRLRIGISLGDVIHEGGDIFGEGVNLAARLEGLAEPGGICIARNVYEQARNRLPVEFTLIGQRRLKNVSKPTEIWRVNIDGRPARTEFFTRVRTRGVLFAVGVSALVALGVIVGLEHWPWAPVATPKVATSDILEIPTGPRIGVLPFANLTGDPNQDFFAEGMTEEVIAGLTRFRDLHVIARNTMFKLGKQNVDPRDLGHELGLAYVLEGSVRLSPGTVRITAQLIDADDARQVWSKTYDSPLSPEAVIRVQEEISNKIVSAIGSSWGGAIASSELKQTLRKTPQNFSSYQCVLTANALYHYDSGLYQTARDCLRETVRLEPDYTEAWAMLADIYTQQWYGYGEPYPGETYDPLERAVEAAKQAVFLSPDSAIAHYAMAKAFFMAGDLASFRSEVQQALQLNPNEPVFLASLGGWLAYSGSWEEGVALIEKAEALNPESYGICRRYAPALNYFRKGEYDKAAVCIQKSSTGWWVNYMHQAFINGMAGNSEAASEALVKVFELRPTFSMREAIDFHRKYQFEQSYIDLVVEGLQRAGLAEAKAGHALDTEKP